MNEQHFADDIFKRIFFNEKVWIPIKISLKFVPKGPIDNMPALVQIMAWRRPGDKPLSEPMMVNSLTHIYVTRPQWVNKWRPGTKGSTLYRQHFQLHFDEWKLSYSKYNAICSEWSIFNMSLLFQTVAWRQTCAKPLPESVTATMWHC